MVMALSKDHVRIVVGLFGLLAAIQAWTIMGLWKVEDEAATAQQLLTNMHFEEAVHACVHNDEGRPFPYVKAKQKSIALGSFVVKETGQRIVQLTLYADGVGCTYVPFTKRTTL